MENNFDITNIEKPQTVYDNDKQYIILLEERLNDLQSRIEKLEQTFTWTTN